MSVTTPKKPLDMDKHIGLEIELLSPYSRFKVIEILSKSPLAKGIQVKDDSSIVADEDYDDFDCSDCGYLWDTYVDKKSKQIRCDGCGKNLGRAKGNFLATEDHELNIIFKEKDLSWAMKEIKKILTKIKAYTNDSCGLHVHIDMRTRNPEQSLVRLIEAQKYLFKLVKEDRHHNSFCRETPKGTTLYSGVDRHSAINPNAYREHETIEVRMHHGSVDAREIYWWIKSLLCVINGKQPGVQLKRYAQKQTARMKKAA